MKKLESRVVAITGAARGIGAASATRFVAEGAKVVAIDLWSRFPETGKCGLVDENLLRVEADVTDSDSLRSAAAAGVDAFGLIDSAFINAGVIREGGILDTLDGDLETIVAVNLNGAFKSAGALARPIVDTGRGGSIVLTSSVAGLKGAAKTVAYSAAKHGVVGLMRSMAQELGPHGIRVNSIHPTLVHTPMIDEIDWGRRMERSDATIEDFKELYRQRHLMPVAWLAPDDIVNAVLWLMSDDARFVTGNTLTIDAGLCVK